MSCLLITGESRVLKRPSSLLAGLAWGTSSPQPLVEASGLFDAQTHYLLDGLGHCQLLPLQTVS